MKVSVLQVDHSKPILGLNTFYHAPVCQHLERERLQSPVQDSEIQDWPKDNEASSPNSLGPKRDWPEVRGEEYFPQTVLSWLLAKWVVGESEEAGRRTLSSHGPEKPEEKEIALSLRRWVPVALGPAAEQKQNETEDSPPGPPPGEGAAQFSPSPTSGPLRRLPGQLGAWLGLGGRRSPARGSTRRPMCRLSLGRSSSGGHRRAPTATGRLRPGPGGSGGWCITPGQDVLNRLGLLMYCRELLGKALDGVAEQLCLGNGGVEKECFVGVLHLCQVEPEMALLDHHGGHRLPEGPRCDFRRS